MAVVWDEATWNATYRIRIRDPNHPQHGQAVGYTRLGMARLMEPENDNLTLFQERWARLVAHFGFLPADRILVAGSAFGFLIEVAKDAGFPNIWGVDNSPYIAARSSIETRGDVVFVADDIRGGARVRNALRDLTGANNFKWVISEDVLTSYAVGAEMTQMLDAAQTVLTNGQPLTNIIHMVTEAPLPAPFTELTLEQWKALRPTHSFVSIRLSQWRVL